MGCCTRNKVVPQFLSQVGWKSLNMKQPLAVGFVVGAALKLEFLWVMKELSYRCGAPPCTEHVLTLRVIPSCQDHQAATPSCQDHHAGPDEISYQRPWSKTHIPPFGGNQFGKDGTHKKEWNHQLNILAAMPGAPLPNRCLLHHGRHGLVPRKGVQGHHSQDKARGQSKPHGLTLHGETSQYVMHVLYVMYVMYQSLPELRTDVNK